MEKNCPVCLCEIENKKILQKCGHEFCRNCIERSFKEKPVCPLCGTVYGIIYGDQPPNGTMTTSYSYDKLNGFEESNGTYIINYHFPSGIQMEMHPNPGNHYEGAFRIAYLPDTEDGRKLLSLLRIAFERRLTFTIGTSRTTGLENVVTWNDIHHKTSTHGGPQYFGYPDNEYLHRLKDELASKGITSDDLGTLV